MICNVYIHDSKEKKVFLGNFDEEWAGVEGTPQEFWSLATQEQISEVKLYSLKASFLRSINTEASCRILAKYPQYKQNNMLGEISVIHNKEMLALKSGTSYELSSSEKESIRKYGICIDYINQIREKSNTITQIINQATEISEIQYIVISDDKYW